MSLFNLSIEYFKNLIESYSIYYHHKDYNNHNISKNNHYDIHYYDDIEYKIKGTVFKNGKVQPAGCDKI